jgi:hypothetical protein
MYRIESPEDGGKAPNGPNFLLIVALFGVTILICLALACLFIPEFGRFIHAVKPDHHPTSQIVPGRADHWLA